MALRPGKKADNPAASRGVLFAAGRFVGFCLLILPAMAILAGVALLPAYARLAELRYQRDTEQAKVADEEAMIVAYDRLIEAAKNDPVLNKRLAMSMFGTLPRNEYVVIDPDAPPTLPPGVVAIQPHPKPQPPSSLTMRVAEKLRHAATRRALFLLAAGAMITAMFLFSPPEKYQKPPTV